MKPETPQFGGQVAGQVGGQAPKYPYAPQKVEVTQLHKTVSWHLCPEPVQEIMDNMAYELEQRMGGRKYLNFFHCWKNNLAPDDPNDNDADRKKCGFTFQQVPTPADIDIKLRWWYNPKSEHDGISFQASTGMENGTGPSRGIKVPKNVLGIAIHDGPTPETKYATEIYNWIEELITNQKYGPASEIYNNGSVARLESGPDFGGRFPVVSNAHGVRPESDTGVRKETEPTTPKAKWGGPGPHYIPRNTKRITQGGGIEQE